MRKRLLFEIASLVCLPLLQAQDVPVPIPQAKIKIENVTFQRVTKLSPAQQRDLIKDIRKDTDWPAQQTLRAVADSVRREVLAAYADGGYWRAKVTARAVPERLLDTQETVDVVIWATDEGRQYRLRDLQWMGAEAFPEEKLLALMPLHPGQVLQRSKVSAGMEAARRLYASHGYINYTAVPELRMDDTQGTASLQIKVDEGGVFTFERFDVVGTNTTIHDRLLEAWPLRPGDVYASGTVEDFVRQHASLLPPAGDRDVVCRTLDLSNHTVEFVIDLRSQPLPCSSAEKDTTSQSLNRLLPEP